MFFLLDIKKQQILLFDSCGMFLADFRSASEMLWQHLEQGKTKNMT